MPPIIKAFIYLAVLFATTGFVDIFINPEPKEQEDKIQTATIKGQAGEEKVDITVEGKDIKTTRLDKLISLLIGFVIANVVMIILSC
jgi:t-SNARE complex subunit (syntaxin)